MVGLRLRLHCEAMRQGPAWIPCHMGVASGATHPCRPKRRPKNRRGRPRTVSSRSKVERASESGQVRRTAVFATVIWVCALSFCVKPQVGIPIEQPIQTTDETQYLLFGIHTDVFDADSDAVSGLLDADVSSMVSRIKATGDGRFRKLGFYLVLEPWLMERAYHEKLPLVIREAFQVARREDVAVYFAIESHYFWQTRPDLWNFFDRAGPGYDPENKNNVEWSDWKGTAFPYRFLNWGTPEKLAPHMCYACPRIRSEVGRLVAQFLAPPIVAGIGELRAAGKGLLFAGITVTSEPSIDNYSIIDSLDPALGQYMDQLGAPKVRLGYNALTRSGYTEANPPPDLVTALGEINRQFAAHWAQQLVAAGVPPSKLYTHLAAPAGMPPPLDFTNAPLSAAFNDFSRPGFTTYPIGLLGHGFEPIYDELSRHGSHHWGGTEASPSVGGSAIPTYEYLRWHFDHGATVVVMNTGASSADLSEKLQGAVWGPEAIAAYRRFLSEAASDRPLIERPRKPGSPRRIAPR